MSQIPLATEFENVIRAYYRIGMNVMEAPMFLGLVAAFIGLLCIPRVFGKRTISTRQYMGKIVAFLICTTATLFLLLASSKIPVMEFKKSGFYRYDCLTSSKGGKKNEGYGRYRDCDFSSGPICTKEEPCTPCNLSPDLDQHVQQRVRDSLGCRSCDAAGLLENCNFVEGRGPYCIFRGRRHPVVPGLFLDFEVRPCETCCAKYTPDYCRNVTLERNITLSRVAITNASSSNSSYSNVSNQTISINESYVVLINDTWLPYYRIWWDNETNPCVDREEGFTDIKYPNFTLSQPSTSATTKAAPTTTALSTTTPTPTTAAITTTIVATTSATVVNTTTSSTTAMITTTSSTAINTTTSSTTTVITTTSSTTALATTVSPTTLSPNITNGTNLTNSSNRL